MYEEMALIPTLLKISSLLRMSLFHSFSLILLVQPKWLVWDTLAVNGLQEYSDQGMQYKGRGRVKQSESQATVYFEKVILIQAYNTDFAIPNVTT